METANVKILRHFQAHFKEPWNDKNDVSLSAVWETDLFIFLNLDSFNFLTSFLYMWKIYKMCLT